MHLSNLMRRRREEGLTLLGLLIAIVIVVVILGIIVYFIWKWSQIPPRQIPDEDAIVTTDPAVVEQITGRPAPTVAGMSGVFAAAVPSDTGEGEFIPYTIIIERTTNFVDWEGIQTNEITALAPQENVTFNDTNVFDRAFYRAKYVYP